MLIHTPSMPIHHSPPPHQRSPRVFLVWACVLLQVDTLQASQIGQICGDQYPWHEDACHSLQLVARHRQLYSLQPTPFQEVEAELLWHREVDQERPEKVLS